MISHLSQEKATRLNKSCRVIAWWGPVVPRHWVKRPPNWFHWGANSDLNPVFQRWKRAIDFRHTQFRTEAITVLTMSGCAHLLEMIVVACWKLFFFGLNSILYILEGTESNRTVSSSGEPWGPLLLTSPGEWGSQDGSRAGLSQEESSLREHTYLTSATSKLQGPSSFCNMPTAAVVETREERASQSMEGAPLIWLDQGRGRVLSLRTLDRCS